MKREDVYKLIDGERDYQDWRWNGATTSSGGHHYTVEEWLIYIQDYLSEAQHIMARVPRQTANPQAMSIIRKIAGMCVCAMEKIDTPAREPHG
jgi:hypothetical protein